MALPVKLGRFALVPVDEGPLLGSAYRSRRLPRGLAGGDRVSGHVDGNIEDRVEVRTVLLRKSQGDVEAPLAFDHLAEGLPAHGRLAHRLDVAHLEVPPRHLRLSMGSTRFDWPMIR